MEKGRAFSWPFSFFHHPLSRTKKQSRLDNAETGLTTHYENTQLLTFDSNLFTHVLSSLPPTLLYRFF